MEMKNFVLVIVFLATLVQSQSIKGPPHAEEMVIKKVSHLGRTVKLQCPITGYPQPLIEWSKNGDKIDFRWDRHKTNKRALKIKNVNQDDTGVFICKGVNGFGTAEVRIELIVVDPRSLPTTISSEDPEMTDVAPPVFTYETKTASHFYSMEVGTTFKVSCEALGSPQPEILWFKDGQYIVENVHYQRGKSTVEFSVMGGADAGVYTCKASNLVGESETNFTLKVLHNSELSPHAVVVADDSIEDVEAIEGDSTNLKCHIESHVPPHIKWLKRLESGDLNSEDSIKVGKERYRILKTNREVPMGRDEYLSKLVIPNVQVSDSGMYICFVTNSGFGALTYKSMNLIVHQASTEVETNPTDIDADMPESPQPTLILVICFSIGVFIVLIILITCVIRRHSHSTNPHKDNTDSIPEVQKPFVNNNQMAPPSSNIYWGGSSRHTVYPEFGNQVTKPSDSGWESSPKDLLDNSINQYEVPYSHRLNPQQHSGQNGEDSLSNSSKNFYPKQPPMYHVRPIPIGSKKNYSSEHSYQPQAMYHHPQFMHQKQTFQPFSITNFPPPPPPPHNNPSLQQFLSDYESQ